MNITLNVILETINIKDPEEDYLIRLILDSLDMPQDNSKEVQIRERLEHDRMDTYFKDEDIDRILKGMAEILNMNSIVLEHLYSYNVVEVNKNKMLIIFKVVVPDKLTDNSTKV